MAEGPSILDIVRGPSYNVNLAEVGKPEERPDLIPQLTKDFQIGTNLVETAWVNQYQYQMAQYNLQDAAAKLTGLNTENDLNRQAYQQRADTFPLEQQQRQQGLNANQINLDNAKQQQDQQKAALAELAGWQKEMHGLDINDPNYDTKRAAIDDKYPNAASSPYTQNQRNVVLNNQNTQRQNSARLQLNNTYAAALKQGQLNGTLDPSLDVNAEIAAGRGIQRFQQIQQTEATSRIRAAMARATDPNDRTQLGRLLNEVNAPPGGVSHFLPNGALDRTMNDTIAGYEQKYGLVNPYAGAEKEIIKKSYDSAGNVVSEEKISKVPVSGSDIVAGTAPAAAAPPTYKYDLNKDPDFAAAKQKLGDQQNAPGYMKRVQDEYYAIRKQKGLSQNPTQDEINKQYQASQAATKTQGTTGATGTTATTPALAAPSPAPGSTAQPNVPQQAQPGATPAPARVRGAPAPARAARARRGFSFVFPEEEAPEGSWQRAWNDVVGGQLAGRTGGEFAGPTQEETERGIAEAESRGRYVSAEPGVPAGYGGAQAGATPIAAPGELGTQATGDAPALRALAYGPRSEGATAEDMRQLHGSFVQNLQPGDIAVSPNLLSRYPPLSRWNLVDGNGNVRMRNVRVADTSYYSENNPTYNTIEVWNGRNLGHVHLVPVSE